MHLAGIGFSSHEWNTLIKKLQKNIPLQLRTKLYDFTNSSSESKNVLKDIGNLSSEILNNNPDWILFTYRNFDSLEDCLDLLKKLKLKSANKVGLVMVIQSIKEDLHSILTLKPTFELVNKMKFKISEPELLLNHHIPRFPRIAVNSKFKKIEYVSESGSVLKKTPDEIPLNTIIPFKNLRRIQINNDLLSPTDSIDILMREHSKIIDPEKVVGILREEKACYLFPGIPFNSIKNIKLDKTKIDHLIKNDECTEKDPPFRRLILGLLNENEVKYKQKKININKSSQNIICLCSYRIISNLIKKLLKGIGYANAVTVEEISPEDDNLKNFDIFLKLQDCNMFDFKGQILDWTQEFDLILEPLSQFVILNDIKSGLHTNPLKLQQSEFEVLKEKLLLKEKNILKMNMHSDSDQLIYSQEYDVLKKIEPLANILIDSISTSTSWQNADKDAPNIRFQRALLLCEDENDASELNFKLTQVQRKLWVNPFSMQKPEDLIQLKSKIINSYLTPGSLIIKPAALKHLKNLCIQTKHEFKIAEKTIKRQKEIQKKIRSELKTIQIKKNKLALSWLETNLKKLLFRDLQLLNLDSENM